MCALFSGSVTCQGQTDSLPVELRTKPEIKVSYIGSLIYPGASIGGGFIIKENDFTRQKGKSGSDYIIRRQLAAINISWYHHYGFHDNLYLTTEWIARRIKRSGYYSEFSAGPGYSRTFLGGTTYKVDNEGNVTVKKYSGYNYFMVTVGGGIGYDFSSLKKTPVSVFAKMNLISMFPYNSTVYFRPVLELGVKLSTALFSNKEN